MNELYYYMLVWITSKVTQEKLHTYRDDLESIKLQASRFYTKKGKKDL